MTFLERSFIATALLLTALSLFSTQSLGEDAAEASDDEIAQQLQKPDFFGGNAQIGGSDLGSQHIGCRVQMFRQGLGKTENGFKSFVFLQNIPAGLRCVHELIAVALTQLFTVK